MQISQQTKDVMVGVLGLINPALGLIGSFVANSDKVSAVTKDVTDAVSVATSLMPIVKQFGSGKDVTPQDVHDALQGKDEKIAEFDALIAAKSPPAP